MTTFRITLATLFLFPMETQSSSPQIEREVINTFPVVRIVHHRDDQWAGRGWVCTLLFLHWGHNASIAPDGEGDTGILHLVVNDYREVKSYSIAPEGDRSFLRFDDRGIQRKVYAINLEIYQCESHGAFQDHDLVFNPTRKLTIPFRKDYPKGLLP